MNEIPEWMNWGGWRWVGIFIAWASGCYIGWEARSMRQRRIEFERWLEERQNTPSVATAEIRQDPPDAC